MCVNVCECVCVDLCECVCGCVFYWVCVKCACVYVCVCHGRCIQGTLALHLPETLCAIAFLHSQAGINIPGALHTELFKADTPEM